MRIPIPIVPLMTVATLSVGACANPPVPLNPNRDSAFKAATRQHDPAPIAPQPQIAPGAVIGPVVPAAPFAQRPSGSPIARVATANSKALQEPTHADYMNAVQVYPFSADALYRLYAAPQQVTDIILQPGEMLSAISSGDTVRWAVGDTTSGSGPAKQIHVLVKPFGPGLKTNLVILTDRRTYHLELVSTAHVSMAAISWDYPDVDLISKKSPDVARSGAVVDSGLALEDLNFRYKITGDNPPWRPLRAFDDGQKVYIEFPANIAENDAPPLFVVGADGGSELVNYRVRGDYYIVDKLFAAAELRLGQDKQQIVRIIRNETSNSHGTVARLFGR